jgi:hypothetical protein
MVKNFKYETRKVLIDNKDTYIISNIHVYYNYQFMNTLDIYDNFKININCDFGIYDFDDAIDYSKYDIILIKYKNYNNNNNLDLIINCNQFDFKYKEKYTTVIKSKYYTECADLYELNIDNNIIDCKYDLKFEYFPIYIKIEEILTNCGYLNNMTDHDKSKLIVKYIELYKSFKNDDKLRSNFMSLFRNNKLNFF